MEYTKDKIREHISKLNLGCGQNVLEGYLNIDCVAFKGVDIVASLENMELPMSNDSVDEVICDHVLEHIQNFVPLMEEIFRVCKNRAVVHIRVPYYKYEGAFRDPTHCRFFSEKTFDYFSSAHKYNYYSSARFDVVKCKLTRSHKSKKTGLDDVLLFLLPFKKFFNFFLFNVYTEIEFELMVIKDT